MELLASTGSSVLASFGLISDFEKVRVEGAGARNKPVTLYYTVHVEPDRPPSPGPQTPSFRSLFTLP